MATTLGLALSDWVVTEAGFGFDLGAEKFFDIKCAGAGLDAAAVVLVVTARALKMHGGKGKGELDTPDVEAVLRGIPNMEKHLENIQHFGERPIVAINRFATDSDAELAVIRERCDALGVPVAINDHFVRGGEGTLDLADKVVQFSEERPTPFKPLYDWASPVEEKILTVAKTMYGANDVYYEREAKRDLAAIAKHGYADLPICIAKTHSSLSDDPKRRGRPSDFEVTVSRIHINAGAGFLVVLTGDIVRMPGLPKRPRAERVDLIDGEIQGLLT
jgi:formate--tetrahydrofolate ligase